MRERVKVGPEFAADADEVAIHINMGSINWSLTPGLPFISISFLWFCSTGKVE